MFFVSCSSSENPVDGPSGKKGGSHSKLELAGTWNPDRLPDARRGNLIITTNGWLGLSCNGRFVHLHAGKLDDTFDYPYTVEIIYFTESTGGYFSGTSADVYHSEKITFYDASNCTAGFWNCHESYGSFSYFTNSYKKIDSYYY